MLHLSRDLGGKPEEQRITIQAIDAPGADMAMKEEDGNMEDKRPIKLAVFVLLFSLVVRIIWVAFAHVTPISDFLGYDELALKWLRSGHFADVGSLAYRTPGYPGFLAAVYALAGHSWRAAGCVQAVVGALTSGLLVLLAAKVLSPRASAIAGCLHVISPTALAYVPVLATETLSSFLLISGLLCLSAGEDRRGRSRWAASAASGALLGLLMLVRPAAVFFLPAFLLLAVYSWKRRTWLARPSLVLLGSILLVLLPWLVRNSRAGLGPATLSTAGGENLLMGNNDRARLGGFLEGVVRPGNLPEKEQDNAYRREALAWIASHPGRYLVLCGIRAARLFGTEPDTWAAKYLIPNRQNDLAFRASFLHSWGGIQSVEPKLLARAGVVETRNAELLRKLRMVIAPFVLLALVMSFWRWRDYAFVTLPALCYLGGLSFTYTEIRFRELADPLLFIPLAGLVSDLVLQTTELGRRPWGKTRTGAAVLAAAKQIFTSLRGRKGPAMPTPEVILAEETRAACRQEVSGCKFSRIAFADPENHCICLWNYPAQSVKASQEKDGLKCEILGSPDASPVQSGGIVFQATAPRALRLEVSFLEPSSIRAVCVDCYDNTRQYRCVRWHWQVQEGNRPSGESQTYVLVPGKQSWYFVPEGPSEAGATREVHFYLQIAPSSKAGFILHKVEIAE